MAIFILAFQKTIAHEGGYVNDPDDPGGETYKGVARKFHPKWKGWGIIDHLKTVEGFPITIEKSLELREMVGTFYLHEFWNKVAGEEIFDQAVAESIFDFAVNAGVKPSITLAQIVVKVKDDGVVGPNTLKAINQFHPDHFVASFTLLKIARRIDICKKRPSSKKYFFGWVCRDLGL